MAPSGQPDTTIVTRWFGDAFYQLHPLLQTLHSHGGVLHGRIAINHGRGAAGLIGRRLARRLGLPAGHSDCGFRVRITHTHDSLLWCRRFETGAEMISRFIPYGHFPSGGWYESTGPLRLDLGVDTTGGDWLWRLRGARWHGLPIPLALLDTRAGKRIVDGGYVFEVEFRLPLLGLVLRYAGTLAAEPDAAACQPLR
ncbi:MAG: DUF4166 domain-containing protein [Rhodanobacteraceae bacterium]|nr:DUF4166 domain-containing protein [Rhodanobacteraceae bacterium]